MKQKTNEPIIEMVEFYYTGTDKHFNEFLKAIIDLLRNCHPERSEGS